MGTAWYATRNRALSILGLSSYREYLASPRWATIRARVYSRSRGVCEVCRTARASQVHHRSYSTRVLLGHSIKPLVAVCRSCHEKVEFKDGKKIPPHEADLVLTLLIRESRLLAASSKHLKK